MNKRLKILTVLVPIFLTLLQGGCKKDENARPKWIAFSASDIGLKPYNEYSICTDAFGNGYALQESEGEGFKVFFLRKGSTEWSFEEISFEPQDPFYLTDENKMKATSDGSVWLLGSKEIVRFKDGKVYQRHSLEHLVVSGQELGVSRFAVFDNEVWLLHWSSGLYQLDIETGATIHIPSPSLSGTNMLLAIDLYGNKWITKRNYKHNIIAFKNDGTWVTANDPDSLIGCPECGALGGTTYEDFRGMIMDSWGRVCLYSYNYQLFRVVDGIIERLAFNIDPYYDGFRIDNNDHMWFYRAQESLNLSRVSQLYRYVDGTANTAIELTEIFNGNVWPYDLTFDQNNNAWVASNMGVGIYNETGVEH